MRVVDPKQLLRANEKRQRGARRLRVYRRLLITLVILAGAFGLWRYVSDQSPEAVEPLTSSDNNQGVAASTEVAKQPVIRTFAPEEFKDLYNSFSYPNTVQISEPPEITGDADADTRIRQIAEERGYRLRSLAESNLVSVEEEHLIQPLAKKPLDDLLATVRAAGFDLTLTAAFRSTEVQQELFLNAVNEQGLYSYDIAVGNVDESIVAILERVSPPGYSRHHSGFTVDFQCGSAGLYAFEASPCHDFMAENNYSRLKALGWVPSYPKGASLQGPEPEPWEYIWVGKEALYE